VVKEQWTNMTYASCPTSIVNAPVEIVWSLLTRPEKWGDFYDVRVTSVEPVGPAMVGQTVFAESGHDCCIWRWSSVSPELTPRIMNWDSM